MLILMTNAQAFPLPALYQIAMWFCAFAGLCILASCVKPARRRAVAATVSVAVLVTYLLVSFSDCGWVCTVMNFMWF